MNGCVSLVRLNGTTRVIKTKKIFSFQNYVAEHTRKQKKCILNLNTAEKKNYAVRSAAARVFQ
jgi:hypothetical protein